MSDEERWNMLLKLHTEAHAEALGAQNDIIARLEALEARSSPADNDEAANSGFVSREEYSKLAEEVEGLWAYAEATVVGSVSRAADLEAQVRELRAWVARMDPPVGVEGTAGATQARHIANVGNAPPEWKSGVLPKPPWWDD